MPIEKQTGSLYGQLAGELRQVIALGRWKNGDLLPMETELRMLYGVSRGRALRSIEQLVVKGLVQQRQRAGVASGPPGFGKRGTVAANAPLGRGQGGIA